MQQERMPRANSTPGRIHIPAIATALFAAFSGDANAARVDYAIDAGVEHDDNVLVEAFDPVEQQIWRTGIGFLATETNSAIQLNVNGRVDYRGFHDSVYANTVEGVMNGRLNWMVIPNRLSFTVDDILELQAIDRFAADSPDNRQQINTLSVGPNLFFNISRTMRGQIEARYIDTYAEVTPEFNSQRWALALRAVKDFGPTRMLSFNAQTQDVDFDDDLVALDYKRNDLYARYEQTFPNFDIAVDLGYSHLSYRHAGNSTNPLMRTQLTWRASERSRLTMVASDQFTDAANTAISDVGGTAIPDQVLIGNETLTAAIYEEQRLALAYVYDGTRIAFIIEPYARRITYPDTLHDDEKGHGVRIGFDYRLRPSLTLSSYVDMERVDYDQIDRTDDTRHFGLTLDKQWSRHWSTALTFYRYDRTSPIAVAEAEQNVVYLRAIYRNR